MSCELDQLLTEAWTRLGPSILADERELKARLARRRSRFFEFTPREFCIALRAADHRINPRTAPIWPLHAVEQFHEAPHHLRLESPLIREICRPVHIAWPGEPIADVQKRLGCSHDAIVQMHKAGHLNVRYVKGLRGNRGSPTALVYTPDPLDPCSRTKTAPARLIQALWTELPARVPLDLCQDIQRIPWFQRGRGANGFMGWNWLCPSCSRPARVLYLPLGASDWAAAHNIRIPAADELDAIPTPPPCFACRACSPIAAFSTATDDSIRASWDHLIMHCSGGLLFGREVRRPDWLKPETAKQRRLRERQEDTEDHRAARAQRITETETWDRQRMAQSTPPQTPPAPTTSTPSTPTQSAPIIEPLASIPIPTPTAPSTTLPPPEPQIPTFLRMHAML